MNTHSGSADAHDARILRAWAAGRLGARNGGEPEVIFGQVREDAGVEVAALRTVLHSGVVHPSLVAVGSGGCTGFSLLTVARPSHLLFVDINPAQIHLLRLKAAVLAQSDASDIGPALTQDARMAFCRVRETWEASTRAFWDARQPLLDRGLNQCGLVDRRMRFAVSLFHRFVQTPQATNALLNARSIQQQREIYATRWKRGLLRAVFRIGLSRPALRLVYGPEFVRLAPSNLGALALERLESVFTTVPARNNPYLWQVFAGRYPHEAAEQNALPPYLLPSNLRAVRAGLESVEYAAGDMAQVLENAPPGSVHFVALSNILEGMGAGYGKRLFAALERAMHGQGAAVLRFLLPPPPEWEFWLSSGLRVDSTLSANLEAQDRSLFCRFIRVVRKAKN